MNSEIDGFLGLLAAVLFIAGIIVVFIAGVFLLPVVLVAGAIVFYVYNTYLPAQKEARAQERTQVLLERAGRIAPKFEAFEQQLLKEGIEDEQLLHVALKLYRLEGLSPPDEPPPLANTIEGARYRDKLLKFVESSQTGRFEEFQRELVKILRHEQHPTGSGIFEARAPRTPQQIEDLIMAFFETEDCFKDVRNTLDRNYNEQDAVMPTKYKGDNCAFDYLKDTPLLDLEYINRKSDLTNRTAHTMILGGSGSGKTNLIEYIIGQDLLRNQEAPTHDEMCTVVVIDSQVQMIPKLANLDIPADDVTYLNPKWNIGLNLFDVGYNELKSGNDAETAINKAVGLIRFVLEGTLTSPMTDRQRTMFDYAIQLIISIPGGNIVTFIELLEEDGHLAYAKEISQFDKITQDFFMRDWGSNDYKKTREAIRARLLTLLKNPTFRRLFDTTENNFKVYDELQSRQLILLDTNKPMLDAEGSSFLGRLYIAMIVQAAHRRFDNNEKKLHPVYVVIDEAQEYFDERIAEMLEQARKANIGLILAHQTLSQIKDRGLNPATVIGNTATKLVSTTYQDDAREMGKSMRVKAEAILDLPQYTFAMHTRETGLVPIRAPEHGLASFEYRTDKGELQVEMEARYGVKGKGAPVEPDMPSTEKKGDGDENAPISKRKGNALEIPPDDFDLDDVRPI